MFDLLWYRSLVHHQNLSQHSFLCARWAGHPEKFVFDRMSRYSQVFRTSHLREPIAVLCGRTGNKFLFSNENKLVVTWFPSAVNRIFPSSLQSSATEEGIKVRKKLVQVLKGESLKHYIGDMDRHAQMHFATGWEGKDRVKALPLVKRFRWEETGAFSTEGKGSSLRMSRLQPRVCCPTRQ